MEQKYEDFYYNREVYPIDEYWNRYDIDKRKTEAQYDGKMFCLECHKARLIAVKGFKRRYFKSIDINEHAKWCVYRLESLSKKEINYAYKNLTDDDIYSKLNALIRILYKINNNVKRDVLQSLEDNKDKNLYNIVLYVTKENKKGYLPYRKLVNTLNSDDCNITTLFYGKCFLDAYIDKNKEYGYLNIYNEDKTKKQCSLSLNKNVLFFLEKTISKFNDKVCFISFCTELKYENNGKYITLKGRIKYSKHILIEKI